MLDEWIDHSDLTDAERTGLELAQALVDAGQAEWGKGSMQLGLFEGS